MLHEAKLNKLSIHIIVSSLVFYKIVTIERRLKLPSRMIRVLKAAYIEEIEVSEV